MPNDFPVKAVNARRSVAGLAHQHNGISNIKAVGSSGAFGMQLMNFFWGVTAAQLLIALIKKAKERTQGCPEGASLEELIKEKERLEDLIAQAAASESVE